MESEENTCNSSLFDFCTLASEPSSSQLNFIERRYVLSLYLYLYFLNNCLFE